MLVRMFRKRVTTLTNSIVHGLTLHFSFVCTLLFRPYTCYVGGLPFFQILLSTFLLWFARIFIMSVTHLIRCYKFSCATLPSTIVKPVDVVGGHRNRGLQCLMWEGVAYWDLLHATGVPLASLTNCAYLFPPFSLFSPLLLGLPCLSVAIRYCYIVYWRGTRDNE